MASLPQVGLEAVIAGLPGFNAGASAITSAYDNIEKKAENVSKATKNMGSSFSTLTSPLSAVAGQFTGLGDSLLKVGAIAGGAALAGVTALGAGLTAVVTSGVSKAQDLDQQMSNIAATMGVAKDAIAPLKQEILDLALNPNLTVTATQAADAIEKLAANGLTMQQILDGAAESTVAMANATGADFTTAANIATGAMAAFNLEADDLTQVADGITGVLVTTKFGAEDYAGALAQAGGIMGGLGVSVEDFNTVLAASASTFASGSDAGTSFKTFLQRLSNPTDEARAAMEKYGISLFDAEGKMRPLGEVAQQLNTVFHGTVAVTETVGGATKEMTKAAEQANKAIPKLTTSISQQEAKLQLLKDEQGAINFHYGESSLRARKNQLAIDNLTASINENKTKLAGYEQAIVAVNGAQAQQITSTVELTEAQKAELATVIGGADAARTVLALSELTGEQFDTLSGQVNDTGQAMKAAATRVDSVKGAMEIFGGVIEAIQIQIGDAFLPLIRKVTIGFTQLASQVGPSVVAFFGNIASVITDLMAKGPGLLNLFGADGLAGLFASLGFEGSALFLKKLSELFVLITGDAGTLGETITTVLGGAFTWLTTNLFPMLTEGIKFIIAHFEEFKGAMMGVGVVLGGAIFAAIIAGILSLLTPINLIIAGAALLGAAWAGNWGDIQGKTFAAWAVIQPVLQQIIDWLSINIPIAIQTVSTFWTTTLMPAMVTVGTWITEIFIPTLVELGEWFTVNIPAALETVGTYFNNALVPITAIWSFLSTSLFPLLMSIGNFFNAVFNKALQAMAGLWQNVVFPAIKQVWSLLVEQFKPSLEDTAKTFDENVNPTVNQFTDVILPALTSGLQIVTEWIKKATDFFNSLADAVDGFTLPDVLMPGSPPPFAIALQDIANAAGSASSAISNIITPQALDSLLGVDRNIASVNNAMGMARDVAEDFMESMIPREITKVTLSRLTQIFRENSAEILGATDRAQAFMNIINRMGIDFTDIGAGRAFEGKGFGVLTVG